jgi:hypothetical protein
VNQDNVRIWESKNPHKLFEHERDSPKINVFTARSEEKVYGPFFFAESRVTHCTAGGSQAKSHFSTRWSCAFVMNGLSMEL